MIRVNNMSVAEDSYTLMIVLNQATLAVRSIFADSAHFRSSTHRKTPSLICLLHPRLPRLSLILLQSASQTHHSQPHPAQRHHLICILSLTIHHLPTTFLNSDFVLVNPVPTLVCGVPVDVVAVPHQYNHVPRGPLIPRSPPTHEGGEEQQSDNESARRDGHRPPTHLSLIHISEPTRPY